MDTLNDYIVPWTHVKTEIMQPTTPLGSSYHEQNVLRTRMRVVIIKKPEDFFLQLGFFLGGGGGRL